MKQVKLMKDVYKNAQRVLIWLREEKELTKEAFELLIRLKIFCSF